MCNDFPRREGVSGQVVLVDQARQLDRCQKSTAFLHRDALTSIATGDGRTTGFSMELSMEPRTGLSLTLMKNLGTQLQATTTTCQTHDSSTTRKLRGKARGPSSPRGCT